MNKINFENAPSTNTPLSAENLNLMQDNIEEVGAVVSATEPTTNEKVWFKKGKNLFNKNTPVTNYAYDSSGNIVDTPANLINQRIDVSGTLTFSWSGYTSIPTIRIVEFDENDTFIQRPIITPYNTSSPVTVKLSEYTKYVIISVENNTADSVKDLQIERGTTATEYEAFNKKAIYVKEDDAYEEYIKPQVKVSATEPTNEDVWFKYGKNKFNKSLYTYERVRSGQLTNYYYVAPIYVGMPNTSYYISTSFLNGYTPYGKTDLYVLITDSETTNDNWVAIGHKSYSPPTNNDHYNKVITSDEKGCLYLKLHANASKADYEELMNNSLTQIEAGSKQSEYEPFVEKAIYTKNANGVFEEFIDKAVSVSNEYGTATKYPDGTLVYKGEITVLANGDGITISCPVQFVRNYDRDAAVTFANKYYYSKNIIWGGQINTAGDGIYAYCITNTGTVPTVDARCSFIAIGRWK